MLLLSGMKLSQSVEVIAYSFFVNLFVDIIIGFLFHILINLPSNDAFGTASDRFSPHFTEINRDKIVQKYVKLKSF